MSTVKEIIQIIEDFAPIQLQENYDNSGLLVGDYNQKVEKVLTTLDCTEAIVQEAIDKNCELIIAHHPIIFGGLKSLTGKNYIEKTIIAAIKNNISIYACHTNLDNVKRGVNHKLAEKIGLQNTKILSPKTQTLLKLETFCPKNDAKKVREALSKAGAGAIGNYFGCSFSSEGIGRFTGNEFSNPTIGEVLKEEQVSEEKIEVVLPKHLQSKVLKALFEAHPYEEVAYFLTEISNQNPDIGSGMIGELETEMETQVFFDYLKEKLNLQTFKFTHSNKTKIKTVALCGGSGSFLIKTAKTQGADVFISSDIKYHEFFDGENELKIIDIGHYETETYTKELFYDILKEKITNIAVVFAETNTNPVNYY
jgi:dinuclear metal center YbgI/SA1388 family protein